LALGKEGPLVHTGACIASLLGQVGYVGAIMFHSTFISFEKTDI
jgi:H+/Cl- antiporter ClcA